MALNKENLYTPEPIITNRNKTHHRSTRSILPMSPKLSFKTSRDRSSASMLSLSGPRTPKMARRSMGGKNTEERTVTIKCQRLTADKQYEEVEVEVPEPIYETLRFYNEKNGTPNANGNTNTNENNDLLKGKKSPTTLTMRIKNLFAKS